MQLGCHDNSSTSPHSRDQVGAALCRTQHLIPSASIQVRAERGMEKPLQTQTPRDPGGCSSPGLTAGRSCRSWELKVAVILVTVAGALILLLLYKLLQLRHRLSLAGARNALQYNSFYHSATYRLKSATSCRDLPVKNGVVTDDSSPVQTVIPVIPPPPPVVLPPLPPRASPSPTPRVQSLPLPVISTTPPSPHLSWGACSDADVYSRIGAFRPSRLSSLSSRSTVILFEHSAL